MMQNYFQPSRLKSNLDRWRLFADIRLIFTT